MPRGRPRKELPMEEVVKLRQQGYSVRMISYPLEKNLGVRISHSTISRRLRELEGVKV